MSSTASGLLSGESFSGALRNAVKPKQVWEDDAVKPKQLWEDESS